MEFSQPEVDAFSPKKIAIEKKHLLASSQLRIDDLISEK